MSGSRQRKEAALEGQKDKQHRRRKRKPSEEAKEYFQRKGIIVNSPLVSVRLGPRVIDKTIGYVRSGDKVDILKIEDDQVLIDTRKSLIGYVSLTNCKEVFENGSDTEHTWIYEKEVGS